MNGFYPLQSLFQAKQELKKKERMLISKKRFVAVDEKQCVSIYIIAES